MLNLDVAVSSFWQLARHWKNGQKAKLELTCEDENLYIQLSATLGHPDSAHFPAPFPPPQPASCKRKSRSQLRRQERRREETLANADKAISSKEASSKHSEKEVNEEAVEVTNNMNQKVPAKKSIQNSELFKCDQCDHTASCKAILLKHTAKEHKDVESSSVTDSNSVEAEPSTALVVPTTTAAKPTSELTETETIEDPAQVSFPVFKCDQCNYTTNTGKGLGQHVRMRHRISQVDGTVDSDEEHAEESNLVTLELNDLGDIIGPELSLNSTPPHKVFHPNAGMGILEDELSVTSYGDNFLCYFFPDDPKTYIVPKGPRKGLRERSLYDVFLCPGQ